MKRILLVLTAIVALGAAAAWIAAEESYVLKLKADVGTSLKVTPHGSIDFGHVYGQESRNGRITVAINDKAKGDENLIGLLYRIECNDPAAGESICPNVSISSGGINKLQVQDDCNSDCDFPQSRTHSWTYLVPDCQDAHQKEPDKKEIACTQSTNLTQEGAISISRTGLQGTIKDLVCDKKTGELVDAKTGAGTGTSCTPF